jgi:transcriptional regulator
VVCIWPDPREPANKGLCSGQGSATLDLRTDVPHAQRFLGRGASGDFYRHHAYPDIPPRRIVIKCTGEQPQYLRALPLHYSQEETEQHDGWSLFGYYLAPTNEFYRKILAPREFMEIVSPEEVRQEYAAILEKMLGQHR